MIIVWIPGAGIFIDFIQHSAVVIYSNQEFSDHDLVQSWINLNQDQMIRIDLNQDQMIMIDLNQYTWIEIDLNQDSLIMMDFNLAGSEESFIIT